VDDNWVLCGCFSASDLRVRLLCLGVLRGTPERCFVCRASRWNRFAASTPQCSSLCKRWSKPYVSWSNNRTCCLHRIFISRCRLQQVNRPPVSCSLETTVGKVTELMTRYSPHHVRKVQLASWLTARASRLCVQGRRAPRVCCRFPAPSVVGGQHDRHRGSPGVIRPLATRSVGPPVLQPSPGESGHPLPLSLGSPSLLLPPLSLGGVKEIGLESDVYNGGGVQQHVSSP